MDETQDFGTMRTEFLVEVEKGFDSGQIDSIRNKFNLFKALALNKRGALEQAMRDKLLQILNSRGYTIETFEKFINLCIDLCREEMVMPVLSVVLLGDIFDATTLDICENLFGFVEKNVATWKEPLFFSTCKNNILRMCNDLLRRLSKSQNTIFCGRILLFLAMFFPFSERSGLNIVSEFNLENVTKYGSESLAEDMGTNTMEEIVPETSIKIDYNFYVKFWSLQDYFRSPNQCYNKLQWKEFVSHSTAVLSVFKNYKVEPDPTEIVSNKTEEHHYFAKFLTNQKLLVLQLNDVNFRRTIYLQFLILFQFLNAHVKSKPESFELKPEQAEWVKETTELIYKLIKETPPDGERFMESVQKLFERDEHWNSWKNEGCPALKPVATETEDVDIKKLFRKRRPFGQVVKDGKVSGKIVIPGDEGPKIWDTRGESLKICGKRKYLPQLHKFFEEAIQQCDPNAMIEPQYKKVNNMRYSWSALRLLTMKCPHYFAVTHNPIPKLPDFLDVMCRRIARDNQQTVSAPIKSEVKNEPQENIEVNETEPMEEERENGEVEVQVKRDTDSDTDTKDSKEKEEDEGLEEDEEAEDEDVDDEEEDEEEEDDEDEEDEEGEEEERKGAGEVGGERRNGVDHQVSGLSTVPGLDDHSSLKKELLEQVGQIVAAEWHQLASKLGYKPDEIEYFASQQDCEEGRAKHMLLVWASNEDSATAKNLHSCLTSLSLTEAAKLVTLNPTS